MDKITSERIEKLHPLIKDDLKKIVADIEAKGLHIRITQGLRTIAEQNDLYAQGRTKPGAIVTKAKGGLSFHNYGLAIDFCLQHADGTITFSVNEDSNHDLKADWQNVVDIFLSYPGWEHGDRGYFDNPHFQKVFGTKPENLLAKVTAGEVDENGYVII